MKYFNAADEFFGDLPSGFTFPDGPFREVRLLVDGQLAGVAYPYAVFFTGDGIPEKSKCQFAHVLYEKVLSSLLLGGELKVLKRHLQFT